MQRQVLHVASIFISLPLPRKCDTTRKWRDVGRDGESQQDEAPRPCQVVKRTVVLIASDRSNRCQGKCKRACTDIYLHIYLYI